LDQLIDDLIGSIESGDSAAFRRSAAGLATAGPAAGPVELSAAITLLAPVIPRLAGPFAKAAVFAGALVERGGSPLPLAKHTPARAAADLELSEIFPSVWARASGGQPLPDKDDPAAEPSVIHTLTAAADRLGLRAEVARQLATAWFHGQDWMKLMITLLARREFRDIMADRGLLRAAAAASTDRSAEASWLYGLTLVLDDEQLLVLDPESGRGFQLGMSGVGDNYQLHTLLADRLAPHLPSLEPPEPSWVGAATDAPPALAAGTYVLRRCRLFDGHGTYVYPEGRPADIEPLDGVRVVALHPPRGRFGWNSGRTYEHMRPALTLHRELPPAEASRWLARIQPARQTDLMGTSDQ
jgi:hypothetical protein